MAAIIAALIVMLNLFSTGFRVVCLGIIVAAIFASGPARRATGPAGWWFLLIAGAALSIVGAIVAQPSPGTGGLMALVGGMAVVIAAAMGFPGSPD